MKGLKFFVLLIICNLIASCGFQLRDNSDLPPQLHTLYLQSSNPYGPFQTRLKNTFKSMHIDLASSPQAAPITLEVVSTTLNNTASSVGTSSQATVYTVTYNAVFNLINSHGKTLVSNINLQSSSTMIINAQQPLNSSNQLDLTSAQLQDDIIRQLFAVLSSPEVKQALTPPSKPMRSHHHHKTQ